MSAGEHRALDRRTSGTGVSAQLTHVPLIDLATAPLEQHMTAKLVLASAARETVLAAVPTHFNRHGDPVFARIPSPGRGWTRCDGCGCTGVEPSWVDVGGQLVDDEPENPRIENGAAVADGARLTSSACGVCDGRGWFAPRPKPPALKIRPARDWDRCESCDRRGGYWTEAEDGSRSSEHPGWEWTVCDDCSADRQDADDVCRPVASKPDGSYPDGLGWHPPETGTVHDQAEQRIAAQNRLYGDQLVPLPPL